MLTQRRKRNAFGAAVLGACTALAGGIAHAASDWADQSADKVSLIPSSELLGLKIRTSSGESAGKIDSLLISSGLGSIRYAIVKEAGELDLEDDQRIAVPFSTLTLEAEKKGEVSATASLGQLRGAMRVNEEEISEFSKPMMITQVYDYYQVPDADRGEGRSGTRNPDRARGNMNQGRSGSSENGWSSDKNQPKSARTERGDASQAGTGEYAARSDMSNRDMEAKRDSQQYGRSRDRTDTQYGRERQSDEDRVAQSQNRGSDMDRQALDQRRQSDSMTGDRIASDSMSDGEESQGPDILVTRNAITMIIPGLENSDDLLDANVMRRTGTTGEDGDEDVGEIEELMVEADSGRIAYVVIDDGGFLGIGQENVAMPLQSLTWDAEKESYVTSLPAAMDKRGFEGIEASTSATEISRSQLNAFYRAHNVPVNSVGSMQRGRQSTR